MQRSKANRIFQQFGMPFIILALLFVTRVVVYTQVASPALNCTAVATNGDITLTWTPSTNVAGSFVQYNIYVDNGGGFNLETTITNILTSSYIHIGAGGNLSAIRYRITATYNSGTGNIESPALDTLSSIYLTVNNPGDGTAVLQWNDPKIPMGIDFDTFYYIDQEYPMGTWTQVDSLPTLSPNFFKDTINSVCDGYISYRIRIKNVAGCDCISNIDGDQFQDLIAPIPPIITRLTIDTTTGRSNLYWSPSASTDASAYIILQNINGAWIIIDTVYGYRNTHYDNLNSNAGLSSESYGVAAFDSCWNGSPPAPNTSPMGIPHRTIFVNTIFDICETTTTLMWNTYLDWDAGVSHYDLFRSIEESPYELVKTVGASDSVYLDEDQQGEVEYCYVVRAISADFKDTALSNISCRYTDQPPKPDFAYLQVASVNNSAVDIRFHPDLNGIITEVQLMKSDDGGEHFEILEASSSIQGTMDFVDVDVDVAETQYQYQIITIDSCGNEDIISNIANTIVLSAVANTTTLGNTLQWNAYSKWQGNILRYEIYRSPTATFDATASTPIAIVPPNQLYYEDDISSFVGTQSNGLFCYKIVAIEALNTFGIAEKSESNIVCVSQDPIVYISNALDMNGFNRNWKPVVNLIDFSKYKVRIYTRFGEIIYETDDPEGYWNGFDNGQEVQQGVYVYQLTFETGEEKFIDIKGTITVIR